MIDLILLSDSYHTIEYIAGEMLLYFILTGMVDCLMKLVRHYLILCVNELPAFKVP